MSIAKIRRPNLNASLWIDKAIENKVNYVTILETLASHDFNKWQEKHNFWEEGDGVSEFERLMDDCSDEYREHRLMKSELTANHRYGILYNDRTSEHELWNIVDGLMITSDTSATTISDMYHSL